MQNCYSYILAKRLATVEMDANIARFNQQPFTKSSEFGALKGLMTSSNKTLYDLENDLVAQIEAGKL